MIISGDVQKAITEPFTDKNSECPYEKQCIEYVKSKGVNIPTPVYYAKNIIPNIDSPCLFCAILIRSGWTGHVAFIEEISSDSICFSEQNQFGCGIISFRCLGLDDPSIRGYFK